MSRSTVSRDQTPDRPPPVPDTPGPWGRLVRLFSSITLGVWLLAILFVYSSIGSAGILYPTAWSFWDGSVWVHEQLRQWRGLEMTEFEWFHWWPFDVLMILICLNVATATWRRIPFHRLNYGVWTIHVGILVLCAGSFLYFSTKIEGDSPVFRRQVAVTLPTGETGTLPVMPGNSITVMGADGPWRFDVQSADPHWSMLTGPAKGEQVYSVNVAVRAPEGSGQSVFIRQLLAGYPELTEDVIRSGDPAQPMARAVKVLGRKLIDDDLRLELEHAPQTHLYLANWVSKSWALYVRELLPDGTATPWAQRPAEGIPLYNDYVGSRDDLHDPDPSLPLDPLNVRVPSVEDGDPLAGQDLHVESYLRYAELRDRFLGDGSGLNPYAEVLVRSPGGDQRYDLLAFDPRMASAADGVMTLVWAADQERFDALCERRDPVLVLSVPEAGVELERVLDLTEIMTGGQDFKPLEGSDYDYRVDFWQDDWEIQPGKVVSMAQVSLRSPEREFKRWVFSDPRMPQVDRSVEEEHDHASHAGQPHPEDEGDAAHGGMGSELPLDERLVLTYRPGKQPAPITIIAGPGESDLHLLLTSAAGALDPDPIEVGEPVLLGEEVTLEVSRWLPSSRRAKQPWIVPPYQRVRDAREGRSMVKVAVPGSADGRAVWVPFHQYAFEDPNETMRRYGYRPTRVLLDDNRVVELILSRERRELPVPVVLEDFEVASHVGGFTGRTSSILNWTSEIRFLDQDGLSDELAVSVNDPREYAGLWYFQAQWDPPDGPRFAGDVGSNGLNFTVLGVGNRHGVGIQLLGSILATLGMIYAFYIKPLLRRRLRERHGAAGVAEAARARPRPLVPTVGPLSGDPS